LAEGASRDPPLGGSRSTGEHLVSDVQLAPEQLYGRAEERFQTVVCDHLTKIYGKSESKALDALSFSLSSRGIFVLIGRNGSGKTTLVRILATELEPTSGKATINGIDVVREARKLREKIAIVPQEARPIPWMTPLQTVQAYLLWRVFYYSEAKHRALLALESLGI